jgi:hypothetical protein
MTTNHKPKRPPLSFESSITSFQDVTHRKGTLRGIIMDDETPDPDRIFGATQAIRESIEEAFGREADTQSRKKR